MANGSFVYKDGTPSYLPRRLLPELHDAASAPEAVEAVLAAGSEGIKIFSGSFRTPERTILLPPEIIAAVTRSAHTNDAFVVAHPTSLQGVVNADLHPPLHSECSNVIDSARTGAGESMRKAQCDSEYGP